MSKRFNITGLCIKQKHYMVDVSEKIRKIVEMVEYGDYFTMNRPRQFGKTTTLNILREVLSKKFIVIDTSFEGVGDSLFHSEKDFCSEILNLFASAIEFEDPDTAAQIKKHNSNISTFSELSKSITRIIKENSKPFVLIIDEIDKTSNSKIFLQFLGLLRTKYLAANSGKDMTFQSVILAGLHDIRTLKLTIRDENEARFNSPWNISAKFDIDMSFHPKEIESMLLDYQNNRGIIFNQEHISRMLYQFTNGYPYLVSDLCKVIDEKLNADWSDQGIYKAVKKILNEKSTLFEDVIKNIENDTDLKSVVNEMLVLGKSISYNPFAYEKGIMYGIFKEDKGKLTIDNMIFEELIYNYMLEQVQIRQMQIPISSVEHNQFIIDGKLKIEYVLLKFQEFLFQEYRKEDEKFYESHGRLLFLSYLKPILNGKGFYFVEPQTRENKRLDIVVIWGNEKYVIELKIWNGEKYHEKGLEQLAEYLEIQRLDKGYLLVFNFNQNKQVSSSWISVKDKDIFQIII